MEESIQQVDNVVVLAAGGTGGHIFPAQALAECLQEAGYRPVLITDNRSRKYPAALDEKDILHITCRSLNGNVITKGMSLCKNMVGYMQARAYLKRLKPIAVVGFGGYPSFPTMFAATNMKLKTILHEQNSVLGRVNRILAPKVKCIATAFEEVHRIQDADHPKVRYVGNLVRQEVMSVYNMPYPDSGEGEHIHLLVTGGSQGAKVFSQVIPEAIAALPKNLRTRLRIDQQCHEEDISAVQACYENAGISADLAPFFKDVATRLANAHLVIARAGAGTITELAIAGRPSILVPLPTSMDNHQATNAEAIAQAKAAIHLPQKEFTKARMTALLQELLDDIPRLQQMAKNAHEYAKPDAAKELMALVVGKE